MTVVDVPERVQAALRRHSAAARTVVVAVSGGSDSMALLRACVSLRDAGPEAALSAVHVAHFDHGLRERSAEDADFVAETARSLGAPFHRGAAPVERVSRARGWNLADGARRLRYAFLARVAQQVGAEFILVGHTRDDHAETVVAQLLRGTAYATGIPVRNGRVVRPLLDVARADLIGWLGDLGQRFLDDPANRDTSRLRPWIRHELIPRMQARVPAAQEALVRHAQIQQDVAAFLRDEVTRRFGQPPLPAERLARAPAALQREAIARMLEASGASPAHRHIERIRERLDAHAPVRLDVGRGVVVRIAYGRVEALRDVPSRVEPRLLEGPEDLPAGAPESLLAEELPLTVRSREPGDRIRLPQGTKSVSDLLIDRKVPREERDALRVVARGSEVLWIERVASAVGVPVTADPDEESMGRALALARAGARAGELPVGAIVTLEGRVVGEAHNESEATRDPTAHAEVLAIRRAAEAVGRHALPDATLFVTLEPCPMCLGAVLQSHVGRVVYGAENHRDGALGGVTDLTAAGWKRTVDVRGGVRAGESSRILTAFFDARR